jgi:hypothetical protein
METTSNKKNSNNYIVRLKEENDLYREQLISFEDRLQDFLIHLSSSKFQGFDNSYINVDDVKRFIVELRNDMRYTVATI